VYVDYLQNGRGKLIAAPLCVRPRPAAPVSMPLAWREVSSRLVPSRYTIKTAIPRLARSGDLMRGLLGEGIGAVSLLEGLTRRLEAVGSRGRGA
jgi:bifunctional non-homologous end joining protein LigD